MTWNMGVHIGPAEETPVATQPEQAIIPASQSTADGMWKAVQSLVAVRSRMQSETAAINDTVNTLHSRLDDVANMRQMLHDYADKLKVS